MVYLKVIWHNIEIWNASIETHRLFVAIKHFITMIFAINNRSSCTPLFVTHKISAHVFIFIKFFSMPEIMKKSILACPFFTVQKIHMFYPFLRITPTYQCIKL